jgi:CDP-diacylglycerol--serine O-phosphatidyltransferase
MTQDAPDRKMTASDDTTTEELGMGLVDEVEEEEVQADGQRVTRRGVFLLPNLFTTAALFAGFFSVISSLNQNFSQAAIMVFVAMVLDGFDGRVARMLNASSAFGAEYDSLSDMISFGVAPGLLAYSWALQDFGRIGAFVTFIFIACAALRLARFNTMIGVEEKRYFTGLASPSAAALVAGLVWVSSHLGLDQRGVPITLGVLTLVLTFCAAVLMISNVKYRSFKDLDISGRVPFVGILGVVLVFSVFLLGPAEFLFGIFFIYACSGPVGAILRRGSAT